MHFDLIQSISLAGSSSVPNDDRAGTIDNRAWMIDGATDLGPPGLVGFRGGAAWLASEAQAALTGAPDAPIATLCTNLAVHLEARFAAARTRAPVDRWELPMASLLAVRLGDAQLECGWLGDCAAIIRSGNQISRVGPPGHSKDDEAQQAAGLAKHGLGSVKRNSPILEELRRSRNAAGKCVLSVEPMTMGGLATATLPCAPGDELLLMTDGFSALIDGYAALDESGLMAALDTRGLAALATQLREIEHADAACQRFARFKTCDDATALWLRIAG